MRTVVIAAALLATIQAASAAEQMTPEKPQEIGSHLQMIVVKVAENNTTCYVVVNTWVATSPGVSCVKNK